MNWRPYIQVLKASARENSVNPKQIMATFGITLFRVLLSSAIYKVAFRSGSVEISYQNVIWSIAVYLVFILNLGIRDLFRAVEQDVRSGSVEIQLIKPLDWRLMKVSELIGKNCINFTLQAIILPLFLLQLVGPPDIHFWNLLFIFKFCILSIFAIISALCLFMSIGLTAFWLNDANSVFRLFDKTILVFGGAFVPLALLPNFMQSIARYSPFGVYAVPTQIFNPNIPKILNLYLISAMIWTFVLIVINNNMWNRVQTRIEVNGG